jgi:hypothetical protein
LGRRDRGREPGRSGKSLWFVQSRAGWKVQQGCLLLRKSCQYVSVPVIVVIPGTVKVKVSVLVVSETAAVGPSGEVKLEKDEGETGEPSVEDVLPPVDNGIVTVYVVPVEMVTLRVTGMLLEIPVGPTKLDVLLVPVTGATGVELEPVPYPDGL